MTITQDIAELKQKYGDKKGIKTADQIMRVVKEVERLRSAIQQTLDENGHLADGDVCTLIALKRAIKPTTEKLDRIIEFVKKNP